MNQVAILKKDNLCYARSAPFHPSDRYPEYPFRQIGGPNPIYDSVRSLLILLGMDREHVGKSEWNPLGEIINPGNSVLLKPNFVSHENPIGDVTCLITHGSVIRAILDYVYIALRGEGKIIIGDAPIQNSDFRKILKITGLAEIQEFYKDNTSFNVEIADFRLEASVKDRFGFIIRDRLQGDSQGCLAVDLKDESDLCEISPGFQRFRVTNYDKRQMTSHHNKNRHEYLISKTVLLSDVIINIPKLKTHRKVGMTCSMKNLVGINGSKDWLPHHRQGSKQEGGDEYLYKSIRKRLATQLRELRDIASQRYQAQLLTLFLGLLGKSELLLPLREPYREGSWYGNDTLPRVVADLNKIAFYADKRGQIRATPQRKMMIIVDGVIAGEKEGPLTPAPKDCRVLVAGHNPVAVDLVCSQIVGFDYGKMPVFKYAMNAIKHPLFRGQPEDITILSDICDRYDLLHEAFGCNLIASKGWKGHIEYKQEEKPSPDMALVTD